jgi:hypothetical protein
LEANLKAKAMKLIFIIISFLLFSVNSVSQSLEGIWKGTFTAYLPMTNTVNIYYENSIKVEIILNKDSTYGIYSYAGEPYARGSFTDYVCEMSSLMLDESTIFLKEIKVVKTPNKTTCFKSMNLKITKRKKIITMEGTWQTDSNECDNRGEIRLSKKV